MRNFWTITQNLMKTQKSGLTVLAALEEKFSVEEVNERVKVNELTAVCDFSCVDTDDLEGIVKKFRRVLTKEEVNNRYERLHIPILA